MAASKRRASRTRSGARARAAGGNPATAAAAQDLAESHRRAQDAKTPIAKAATRAVVEGKLAVYSDEAARQAAALAGKSVQPTSTPKRKGTRRQRGSK